MSNHVTQKRERKSYICRTQVRSPITSDLRQFRGTSDDSRFKSFQNQRRYEFKNKKISYKSVTPSRCNCVSRDSLFDKYHVSAIDSVDTTTNSLNRNFATSNYSATISNNRRNISEREMCLCRQMDICSCQSCDIDERELEENYNRTGSICTCRKINVEEEQSVRNCSTTDDGYKIQGESLNLLVEQNQDLSRENRNTWETSSYMQNLGSIEFLAEDKPELSVQYINDMSIRNESVKEKVQILIPISENHIVKQGSLLIEGIEIPSEIYAQATTELNFPAEHKVEQVCPENVDNLNISKEYSEPDWGEYDDVEQESMGGFSIKGVINKPKLKMEHKEELKCDNVPPIKKELVVENHTWDINRTKKWKGEPIAVRTTKINIDKSSEDWNSSVKTENSVRINVNGKKKKTWNEASGISGKSSLVLKGRKKVYNIENVSLKIRESGRKFDIINEDNKEELQIPGKPKIEYLKIDQEGVNLWGIPTEKWDLQPISVELMEYIGIPKEKKNITVDDITEEIEIEEEIEEEIEDKKSEEIEDKKPVEIVKDKKVKEIEVKKPEEDKKEIKKEEKKILKEVKKVIKKEIKKVQKILEPGKPRGWYLSNQRGAKLSYRGKKKWVLKITKPIDLFFEQEDDGIILNDDYNTVQENNLLMRPIEATILKVQEDLNSSVSSYDFLQYVKTKVIVGKKSNYSEKVTPNDVYASVINRTRLNKCHGNNDFLKNFTFSSISENNYLTGSNALKAKITDSKIISKEERNIHYINNQPRTVVSQTREVRHVLQKGKKQNRFGMNEDEDYNPQNILIV